MEVAWTEWRPFPDPRAGGFLTAPFGPGCYEVRNRKSGERVLFGRGQNVAYRMTSLLPGPYGAGQRNNTEKREYCLNNLPYLEYRTWACLTEEEAIECERSLIAQKSNYRFQT
jgi:hypothetical protein